MSDGADRDDIEIEDASREVARAIWEVVLIARDEYKARGLLGKATRKELVQRIAALARLLRRRREGS